MPHQPYHTQQAKHRNERKEHLTQASYETSCQDLKANEI